jgi:hypothetical protein
VIDGRWHNHQAGCAGLGALFGQRAGVARCGLSHGQQRRLAACRLLYRLEHLDALVVAQHRAFAQRAAGDEAVNAGVHLQVEAAAHFLMVELAVFGEFGGDRGDDALPHCRCPSLGYRRLLAS